MKIFWLILLLILAGCGDTSDSNTPESNTETASDMMENTATDMGLGVPCGPSTCGACDTGCQDVSQCLDGTWACACACTDAGPMTQIDAGIAMNDAGLIRDMGIETFENPGVTEVTRRLDMICVDDCAKDVMCNPAQAPTVDACQQMYCDYRTFYGDAADDDGLIACLEADAVLALCIVELPCAEYTRYYYSDDEDNLPCAAEEAIYGAACEAFVE